MNGVTRGARRMRLVFRRAFSVVLAAWAAGSLGCPAGTGLVEPVEPVELVEPVEAREAVGPGEPAGPVAPVEPGEPAEPSGTLEPGEPAEPSGPGEEEGGFRGGDDDALLAVLCGAAPVRWERNPRGTTIGFRLTFPDGSQAAYKPAQTIGHSRWEAEVAAYRLSRRLGIHRVPPSCVRPATRDDLMGAEGGTPDFHRRLGESVLFDGDGTVVGMAMHWVPDLRGGEEYASDGEWPAWLAQGGRIPPERREDAAALSDLVLLDWLTLNTDRWTGGNVRRAGGPDGPLVFIDNAAGFGAESGEPRVWAYFRRAQRFRRETVERLQALDDAAIAALLSDILSVEQLDGLRRRRDRALDRIGELIGQFGEANVLFFGE